MANILKTDKTYSDIRGVVYDDAYMVIDRSYSQALPNQSVTFDLNIYKDEASRTAGFQPVFTSKVSMTPAQINTYLITPQTANSTESPLGFIRKWIYIFLGTEKPVIDSIVWDDWKSDVPGGVPQTMIMSKKI